VFVKVVLAYSNGNGVVKDRLFMMTVNKFYSLGNLCLIAYYLSRKSF